MIEHEASQTDDRLDSLGGQMHSENEAIVDSTPQDDTKEKTLKADYDSAWKEILEKHFESFVQFFFPDIYQDIDWSKSPEFLDKELQQIVGDADTGRMHADKLVKVWLQTGDALHLLIHVEVQGSWEADYPQRMYIYNYRIFDKYKIPVVSISIFTDENPEWEPNLYEHKRWGFELSFKFLTKKLRDYRAKWHELENDSNPFAIITMANLKTMETRGDYEERFRWKIWMFRQLYKRGMERPDIVRLLRFVDWMMKLPDSMKEAFSEEWSKLEEETKVTYMMDIERIGYERGVVQGVEQGVEQGVAQERKRILIEQRDVLINLLNFCYQVPSQQAEAIQNRLQAVDSLKQLKSLIDTCLDKNPFSVFRERLDEMLERD